MVDIFCNRSGETPLKRKVAGEIEISESVIPQITTEDWSIHPNGDRIQRVATSGPSVPQIVIMDSSFSNSLHTKDISFSIKSKGRKSRRKHTTTRTSVLTEGQRAEVATPEAAAISCEPKLIKSGWIGPSLAAASEAPDKHTAMERAEFSPYTSDEWEIDSDTSGDHTDSSDDDDPKSQVDRLIERGTLMYMDDENSALSSEEDSDDDYDSESDITDVSPLASPLGLSPVLPRRHLATSPLALHNNRGLSDFECGPNPMCWTNPHHDFNDGQRSTENSFSMDPLFRAVMELKENRNQTKFNLNHCNSGLPPQSSDHQMFIHPIRDNPHHFHLRKTDSGRKNMSFTNEQVRKIDRDNKILLKKIMAAQHRTQPTVTSPQIAMEHGYNKPSNSAVNRKKGEEKIRRENLVSFCLVSILTLARICALTK